jgi:dTDP-glucose 4,6-dehydratase
LNGLRNSAHPYRARDTSHALRGGAISSFTPLLQTAGQPHMPVLKKSRHRAASETRTRAGKKLSKKLIYLRKFLDRRTPADPGQAIPAYRRLVAAAERVSCCYSDKVGQRLRINAGAGGNLRMHGNMRILVTGGAGFIGSAVCRLLVQEYGIPVVNIDKLTYAANLQSLAPIERNPLYAFERADICDRAALDAIFGKYRPTGILHLAAESHVDRSITGSQAFLETNIVGTYHLLEAAYRYFDALPASQRETFRFVQVSTDEVYGSLGDTGQFHEDTPYQPSSPYSASKAASDHLALAWQKTYGLPVIVSNCSNNYGTHQFPEKLIPLTILNALESRQLPVYGTGANVRDWLHVEDHARGLFLALTRGTPGEKYNFGGNCERTNLSIVQTICDTIDRIAPAAASRRELINFVQDRPGHDHRYAVDASKAARELDWQPQWTIERGLEDTIQWYMANRDWWGPLREKVYDGKRLGLVGAE